MEDAKDHGQGDSSSCRAKLSRLVIAPMPLPEDFKVDVVRRSLPDAEGVVAEEFVELSSDKAHAS